MEAPLDGKYVAVIGTGASAVQFMPQIAPRAGRLYHFQRTPAWIVPKLDHAIPDGWRQRFRRLPGVMRLFRWLLFWSLEIRVSSFLGNGRVRRLGTKVAQRHLEHQIADPKLRAALTPTYEFGCKRVLLSSDFYPALTLPNVELVTEPIAEVREKSIVTADGKERPIDVLIFGTGFHATVLLHGARILGRGGVSFADAWGQRKSAFLGVTARGFPNLFMLLGPNTGLGHNFVVLMIEAQIRYVMSCLKLVRRKGRSVMEVREDCQERFGDFEGGELDELLLDGERSIEQEGGTRQAQELRDPVHVAELGCFLASPEAEGISGQTFQVHGGTIVLAESLDDVEGAFQEAVTGRPSSLPVRWKWRR